MTLDPGIAALAGSVITLLAPFVKVGGEAFAKQAGEGAFKKVEALLKALRKRFAGDKEAKDSLEHFEQKPERYQSALEDILREKLAGDPALLAAVQELMRDAGPILTIIQKMQIADGVIGLKANNLKSGDVQVEQQVDGTAKDLTGVDLTGDVG